MVRPDQNDGLYTVRMTFGRFDTMWTCDRQTQRLKDILPLHNQRYAYAWRSKNYTRRLIMSYCHVQQSTVLLTNKHIVSD